MTHHGEVWGVGNFVDRECERIVVPLYEAVNQILVIVHWANLGVVGGDGGVRSVDK